MHQFWARDSNICMDEYYMITVFLATNLRERELYVDCPVKYVCFVIIALMNELYCKAGDSKIKINVRKTFIQQKNHSLHTA